MRIVDNIFNRIPYSRKYGILSGKTNNTEHYSQDHKDLNKELIGYPSNHNYRIVSNQMIPNFRLFLKKKILKPLYSNNMESFLDIGCCRGYYVLDAAEQANCQVSVGIDVYEPFLSAANKVKQFLNIKKAKFYLTRLHELADDPKDFGGPFQTILFIGAYHYVFWGSSYVAGGYHSHHEILSRLANICTDRIILSARFEISNCPTSIREMAKDNEISENYTTAKFLSAADKYFYVNYVGKTTKFPIFVLQKKK